MRLALLGLIVAWNAHADGRLTGVGADFSRYRLSTGVACELATVDPQSAVVLYAHDACKPLEPGDRFAAPAPAKLAGGRRLIARVQLEEPWPPKINGEPACLTTKDSPCPTAEEYRVLLSLTPRPGTLRVFLRAPDGKETLLAEASGTAREVKSIHASRDGRRILVVFNYEKMLRDSPRESPIGTDVLGVDVTPRWPR